MYDNQPIDMALQRVRQHTGMARPRVGVVLGSGLGAFAERLEVCGRLPYAEVPDMPQSQVVGHAGELVAGTLAGVECAVLRGRVHLYEGHDAQAVTFGVRLLLAWGVQALLLTNAAGGIHPQLQPGTLMLLADHLNLTGTNPLRGRNDDQLGPRFPDMTQAYCPRLRATAQRVAQAEAIGLQEGVYAGLMGPCYETPAEIRMLRSMGADAVGMSTVLETIVARHAGVPVLGLSVVTNCAAGLSAGPLSHTEVTQTAHQVEAKLLVLLSQLVPAMVS